MRPQFGNARLAGRPVGRAVNRDAADMSVDRAVPELRLYGWRDRAVLGVVLAAFAAGMILAYAMVVPGWVAGWTVGSLTGWATTKHPTQVSQAYQPSASTGQNTSAVLKKTDAQRR